LTEECNRHERNSVTIESNSEDPFTEGSRPAGISVNHEDNRVLNGEVVATLCGVVERVDFLFFII